MRAGKKTLIFVALPVLVACQSVPVEQPARQEQPSVGVDESAFLAEPGLTDQQRLHKAIQLLGLGSESQAEAELQAYLSNVPDSKIARDLLRQINTPLNELYPQEFVEIALENGQSLSTIAQLYLGDALQFYALARYNEIEQPDKTVVGQVVRVPMTKQAKAHIALPQIEGRGSTVAEIDLEDSEAATSAPVEQAPTGTASAGQRYSLNGVELLIALLRDRQYEEAVIEYEKLDNADDLSKGATERLAIAYIASAEKYTISDPPVASLRYLNAAELMLSIDNSVDNRESALNLLDTSVRLDNNNVRAQSLLAKTKSDLTDI
ncbi:MAG: hypothetical protein DRR06_07450 [Gammaproteobacteria bacterium]|nr:MAG: hypothetical protein DRR06_07450 [Gammaproteobacteria bacterium]